MQEVAPARQNTLYASMVNASTGAAITTGTVTFYLIAVNGVNAGKWWDDQNGAWESTEAAAGSATHKARGEWYLAVPSDTDNNATVWTVDTEFRLTAVESGALHIAGSDTVFCRSPYTGAGAVTDTVTIYEDDEATVIDGAEVWVTNDVSGVDGTVPVAGVAVTDANGVVTFNLDVGDYWVHVQKGGWVFTTTYPRKLTVSTGGFAWA